jgi:hypothetical protein
VRKEVNFPNLRPADVPLGVLVRCLGCEREQLASEIAKFAERPRSTSVPRYAPQNAQPLPPNLQHRLGNAEMQLSAVSFGCLYYEAVEGVAGLEEMAEGARSSPPRAPRTVSPGAPQLRPKLASPCTACTTILNREIRRTVVERFEGGVRRRVMARRDPAGIHLLTRNGYDWAQKYRLIVEAVNYLRVRSCLIGRGGCLLQPG